MEFDLTKFLFFLAFIIPGFLAKRVRDSIVPRSLKPTSTVAEIGQYVLSAIWVHLLLVGVLRLFFAFFHSDYFATLSATFTEHGMQQFLWTHRRFAFFYLLASFVVGGVLGGIEGWLAFKQPLRTWLSNKPRFRDALGIPALIGEEPVWYHVFRQETARQNVFVEVEMQESREFYSGMLVAYGILDDSEKSKDFYLEEVYWKPNQTADYVKVDCDGLLLNFSDTVSVRVKKKIEALAPTSSGEDVSQ